MFTSMYISACIFQHLRVCAYICVHLCTHVFAYFMNIRVHLGVHACQSNNLSAQVCVYIFECTYLNMCVHIFLLFSICLHIFVCIYIQLYIHVYMYTCTNIHTRKYAHPPDTNYRSLLEKSAIKETIFCKRDL